MERASSSDIIKLTKWLEKNRQRIVEARPSMSQLKDWIQNESGANGCGIKLIKDCCNELKIVWVHRVKRIDKKEIKASISILCEAIDFLFKQFEIDPPQDFQILKNITKKEQ